MATSNQRESPVTEINFSRLLWLVFSGILNLFRQLADFVSRNLPLLMTFLLLGVGFGMARHFLAKPVYKISFLARHTEYTPAVVARIVDGLNVDILNGAAGAQILTGASTGTLQSVEAWRVDGLELADDTSSRFNQPFQLDIYLSDTVNADVVGGAIVRYFNENPYAKKLKQDKVLLYRRRLQFLDSELQRLDSLKREYNVFLSGSKSAGMFYNNAFNPAEVYENSSILDQERGQIQEWLLQNTENLVVIDKVPAAPVPHRLNIVGNAVLFGALFFLLGCLIGAFRSVGRHPSQGPATASTNSPNA